MKDRLYERVTFAWGTHLTDSSTGSITHPRPFTLDWPGHVNHCREVFAVLIEGAGGVLFVAPSQMRPAADDDVIGAGQEAP